MKKNNKKQAHEKIDPHVKDVLLLLGSGAFLTASFLIPGLPLLLKPYLKQKAREERSAWKKFNQARLKQLLHQLYAQKKIDIVERKDYSLVKITNKGKKQLLRYDLESMQLQQTKWDGKWRIIIYDIYAKKRQERTLFQKTLKKMNFYQLQKSTYLTPYSCKNEIEYLRQVCDVDNEVIVLTVSGLENEDVYKEYFGLKVF